MTATLADVQSLSDLVDHAAGRVVCLAMSKDPNAKMTVLLFEPGEDLPGYVAKVPATDAAVARIRRETDMLADVGRRGLGPIAATIPRLAGTVQHDGRPVLVTSALPGRSMLATYHRWLHTARRSAVLADFEAAGRWLAELQQRTRTGHCEARDALGCAAATIGRRFSGDPGLTADLRLLAGLADRLAGCKLPRVLVHGDFWPGNLLLTDGRVSGVTDWENAAAAGPASRDLARFVISYSLYLDRHTRRGRSVPGHPGLRAGRWGSGVDYAVNRTGWYPDLVRRFVTDGLSRFDAPAERWRDLVLAELACIAAEADHPEFARRHLHLLRRLEGRPS